MTTDSANDWTTGSGTTERTAYADREPPAGRAAAAEEEEEEEEEERERVERRLVGGGGEREGETRVG